MAYSHIAHDCVLGNDIVLTNQAALAGSVHVGDGAILGGYAIVHQFAQLVVIVFVQYRKRSK